MKNLDLKDVARLETMLQEAFRVAVISHRNPDGDALGSSFGMGEYLLSHGKEVIWIYPTEPPCSMAFLWRPRQERMLVFKTQEDAVRKALDQADLVLCTDFNTLSRIDGIGPLVEASACPKVLIDHHVGPEREKFGLCFSETEISSACELVFWLLLEMKDVGGDASRLSVPCAYALLCGMTTDTNNFANSVWPTTLEMASRLIAAGVDRNDIITRLFMSYPERRLRALGWMLSERMTLLPRGGALLWITKAEEESFGLQEGDVEGFVNQPLSLEKVRLSVFVRESDGKFRVSVRSKAGTSARDLCCRYFHGGGHELASGGTLTVPEDFASPEGMVPFVTANGSCLPWPCCSPPA